MAALSAAQIGRVAYGAGFRGAGLQRAIAVALAESAGNPHAVGHNSDRFRSVDRGLWQINSHWHPEVSAAEAFNPASAARAAYRISHAGRDWSQWSTWKNGSARAQMGRAKLAMAHAGAGASSSSSSSGSNPNGSSATVTIIGADNKPRTYSTTTGKMSATPAGATADPAGIFGLPDLPHPFGFDPHNLGVDPFGLFGDGVIEKPAKALGSIYLSYLKAAAWVADSHNWGRIALVAGGSVGVLMGMYALGQSGAAGSTAGKALTMPVRAAKGAAKSSVKHAATGAELAAMA